MLKQCLRARLGHTFKTAIAYHRLGAAAFDRATRERAFGVAKPDPAIYNLFHDRLRQKFGDIPASSLWFVDDKAKNVDAARALGWNGCVFNATTTMGGLLPELAAAGLSP